MTEFFENFKQNLTEDSNVIKPKKFVFQIYPENIEYIENLSFEEKNDLINNMINEYRNRKDEDYTKEQRIKIFKSIFITFLTIIVAVPLIIFLINASFTVTKSSYGEMQKNFTTLYHSKGR